MPFALSDMTVRSPAFEPGGAIPKKHTQEGENVSPALQWSGAPSEAKSFAVICHDPDAPLVKPSGQYGYVHWVLSGIPGSVQALPEGVLDYVAGKNDSGNAGYDGPMPPESHGRHHYFFWVLALKEQVQVQPGLSLHEVLAQLEPHLIGMNRLVGTYQRPA